MLAACWVRRRPSRRRLNIYHLRAPGLGYRAVLLPILYYLLNSLRGGLAIRTPYPVSTISKSLLVVFYFAKQHNHGDEDALELLRIAGPPPAGVLSATTWSPTTTIQCYEYWTCKSGCFLDDKQGFVVECVYWSIGIYVWNLGCWIELQERCGKGGSAAGLC